MAGEPVAHAHVKLACTGARQSCCWRTGSAQLRHTAVARASSEVRLTLLTAAGRLGRLSRVPSGDGPG
eukprot:5759736-Prymnesium_polylepis.2